MKMELLEQLVVTRLREAGLTLSAAESCTGGLLSKRITDISGASAVFMGGAVTYTIEAKERLVGVEHELLMKNGAVHPEVAKQMAAGVRRVLSADLGIGITGLAGPYGDGSAAKVGDVYIGFSAREGTMVLALHAPIGRDAVRKLACDKALELVCRYLDGETDFYAQLKSSQIIHIEYPISSPN